MLHADPGPQLYDTCNQRTAIQFIIEVRRHLPFGIRVMQTDGKQAPASGAFHSATTMWRMISTRLRAWSPAALRRPNSETVNVIVVLAPSGIGGFHVGMVTFPDWQVAVETAQVVAGIIHYPSENPFCLYHLKVWTVLHQIGALLLLSGLSEIALRSRNDASAS
jgi:hypothetical protein